MRRLLAPLLVLALVAPTASAGTDEDLHPSRMQTGNPITTAISENVDHVDSDPFTGGHVVIEGDRLYVGAYGVGMRIFDISDPASPRQIGGYLPGNRADAVPDAAVYGDRHIAVLNGTARTTFTADTRTDRAEFLDVTDPADPVLLHQFVGPADGEAHNGDIVDDRRLWLPSGGGVGGAGNAIHGLRIYDLSPTIDTPASECTPDAAENPCRPEIIFRGNPVDLWAESPHRRGRPVGAAFTHTHDITVYTDLPVRQPDGSTAPRDIVLLAEGGNYLQESTDYGASGGNTGSVFVIDITDPGNPVALLRWHHQRGPDHHPIRYHHEAQLLDADPRVMLVTDEDLHHPCGEGDGGPVDTAGGHVVAVRLSADLTEEVAELSEWFIPLGTPAPVCSVHVFSSAGDLVYIGSYNAGLQVVSYADPANPRRVGFAIAPGATSWGAQVHGEYVYVGDMSRGLDTFRFAAPDLVVSPSGISLSPEKPRQGDLVTVTATIRNTGKRDVPLARVTFELVGVSVNEAAVSVPAGGSATATAVWSTLGLSGPQRVEVTVDPDDLVTELREDNNTAGRSFQIR
jgi:hypothetical protein